jgi:hypothetical protein
MKAQGHTPSQSATPTAHRLDAAGPCPQCRFTGPHYQLDELWVECGRNPISMGPHTWVGGCGATWQVRFDDVVIPADTAVDRVIDLIDASNDVGVIDCPHGHTVLTWKTTLELAVRIAGDTELRARIADTTREAGAA